MISHVLALSIIHDATIIAAGVLGVISRIYMLTVINSMGKEDMDEIIKM